MKVIMNDRLEIRNRNDCLSWCEFFEETHEHVDTEDNFDNVGAPLVVYEVFFLCVDVKSKYRKKEVRQRRNCFKNNNEPVPALDVLRILGDYKLIPEDSIWVREVVFFVLFNTTT